MQNMEIVVVNFGANAPIYTEAVFPDPEVRSIAAEKEEQARQRRREARRRARHNERRNNERRNAAAASSTTTARATAASARTTITTSSRPSNRTTTNRTSASSRPNRPSTAAPTTASTSGQQSRTQDTDSDSDSDSDSGHGTQDSSARQTDNSVGNSDEEWIVCAIPRNNSEEVQISVHSEQHQQQQQQTSVPPPTTQLLTVPPTNQRRAARRRFRWFSRHAPTRNVPMANQNRHHPDEEDVEEWLLTPEPSPHPSPIQSPVIQRIARKWRDKSPIHINGCNTCRGDVAIHSHQRPRLSQRLFKKVFLFVCYKYECKEK